MNAKRNFFTFLLISLFFVCFALGFSSCEKPAEEVVSKEGVVYELSKDGAHYSVADYRGAVREVVIERECNGLPVTAIDEYAFNECHALISVTIPESVTSIGRRAFYWCRNLTSVTIPEGVTSIEERTFYQCDNLTNVTIPDGVTSIGEEAFYHSGECKEYKTRGVLRL